MSEEDIDITPQMEVKAPTQEEERVANFQNYIFEGGKLIAEGNYIKAIKHFRNKSMANSVGLSFLMGRGPMVDRVEKEDIGSISNSVAMNSWFIDGRISPSSVLVRGKDIAEMREDQFNPEETALAHEIALVHMEEFLHGLQNKRGKPLASHRDTEIDVADWMHKNNVPLTEAFLARYDRGLTLFGQEGKDDSLSEVPAIRKGVFLNVLRSSGTIDSNWQITGFDPVTGDLIVIKYSEENLKKAITREEYIRYNERGVYPFKKADNFIGLFSLIDQLKVIQGSTDIYGSNDLKRQINTVREGKASLETIPRAGGLRLKVAELLNAVDPNLQLKGTTFLN